MAPTETSSSIRRQKDSHCHRCGRHPSPPEEREASPAMSCDHVRLVSNLKSIGGRNLLDVHLDYITWHGLGPCHSVTHSLIHSLTWSSGGPPSSRMRRR